MQLDLEKRCQKLAGQKTLKNLFALTCENPKAVSAIYRGEGKDVYLTYEDSVKMTYAAASAFRRQFSDLLRGSFIAISLDTCPLWFPVFWGLLAAGYNVLLLDPQLDDQMTAHLLQEAGAKASVSAKRRHLGANCLYVDEIDFNCEVSDFVPAFAEKIALCTSGTTDTSRIFVYDQSAICEQVLNTLILQRQNKRIVDGVNRRALAFLPFHHVFGLMVNLLWAHFIGYETVYLQNRAPETIMSTVRHFGVNYIVAVPLLVNSLCTGLQKKVAKEPLAKRSWFHALEDISLLLQKFFPEKGGNFARNVLFGKINDKLLGREIECIILGGSHTPKEHMRTMAALGYFAVGGFGMTETAITSVETAKTIRNRISGSVGLPLESVAYKIIPNAGDTDTGELLIKGASLHTGQLKAGKLLPAALDKDGWYATGDIVRFGKNRRMFVEGRSKDLIINESGENVYPDEIEDAFQDLPGVSQLCVLGLKQEDGQKHRHLNLHNKEKLKYEDIALILSVGNLYNDNDYKRDLKLHIIRRNAKLPVRKKVTRVLLTPEKLEITSSLKVKRRELKNRLETKTLEFCDLKLNAAAGQGPKKKSEENRIDKASAHNAGGVPQTKAQEPSREDQAAASRETLQKDVKERVRKAYADTLEIAADTISDHAHFVNDLGGDSLQVISLMLKIEEMFGVTMQEEDYGLSVTVDDLSSLLLEKMQGKRSPLKTAKREVMPVTTFENTKEYQSFIERYQALLGKDAENPYFVCHESALTDKSLMDEQWVLNFGSYNYVGMSGRQEVQDAAKRAIDRYGTSASGSRLLAGEKKLYQELEREISDWKHTEDALVLVGGHSTNVTLVGNFCGQNDLIIYDALAHNSIAEGCRLSRADSRPFPHNDVAALDLILKMRRASYEKVLIVVEGAYSMDGDIADIPALVAIKKKYGCFLMVDEAHSACVLGQTGGGVDEYFNLLPRDIDIKMGTLSKGLGACGGYLAGSHNLIEYLRYNLPGFVFSVGISPPLAAACLEAIRLLRSNPSIVGRLHDNIHTFIAEARKRQMNTCLARDTAIIPILVGEDEAAFLLSNMMRQHGVFVPPAVYPAVPKGKARLRFCVNSEHTEAEIIKALDTLLDVSTKAGIVLPR